MNKQNKKLKYNNSILVAIKGEDNCKDKTFDVDFRAPQSYCYIDNVEFIDWLLQNQ